MFQQHTVFPLEAETTTRSYSASGKKFLSWTAGKQVPYNMTSNMPCEKGQPGAEFPSFWWAPGISSAGLWKAAREVSSLFVSLSNVIMYSYYRDWHHQLQIFRMPLIQRRLKITVQKHEWKGKLDLGHCHWCPAWCKKKDNMTVSDHI